MDSAGASPSAAPPASASASPVAPTRPPARAPASPHQAQAQPAAVLRSTWECKLPVRVWVAPNSISSPTPLPPFYVLVPRQGYLSSISAQLWPQVQHVLPKLPGMSHPKPWFDYEGVPLRSSLPVGVLFDLLSPLSSSGATADADGAPLPEASALPWQLVLHYTHAPAEVSVSWLASLPPHTLFMNSLKEACYICKGGEGSAAVMRMPGASQDALWSAVDRCDVVQYATCLAALKVTPSVRSQGAMLPSIPVRLVLRQPQQEQPPGDTSGGGAPQPQQQQQQGAAVWSSVISTSRPVPALTAAGTWASLGDVLHAMLPSLFPVPAPSNAAPPVVPADLASPPQEQPSQPQQEAATGLEALQQPAAEAPPPQPGATASQGAGEDGGAAVPTSQGRPDISHQQAQPHDQADPLAAAAAASQDQQAGAGDAGSSNTDSILLPPAGATPSSSVLLQAPNTSTSVQPQLTLPMLLTAGLGQAAATSTGASAAARCEWRVCGVRPPLETPLAWLHANLHAPDYFLYVVVRADLPSFD